VNTFLSGLKDELCIVVTMLRRTTLPAAFGLARLQEDEVFIRTRSYKNPNWPCNPSNYQANRPSYLRLNTSPLNPSCQHPTTQPKTKTLTQPIPTLTTGSQIYPIEEYPQPKCKKEGKMGYATIVMICTSLGKVAIDLSSIFWGAWRWKEERK
jgi:hypothetical protein